MGRLLVGACLLITATAVEAADISLPAESRTRLAIAVYGDGHGLVWDSRTATLEAGANRLAFEAVSRHMVPSSAMIMAGPDLQLRDIVYDLGPLTQEALLRSSVGETLGLVRKHPTTGEEAVDTVTLLSVAEKPIVNHRDRIEAVDPGRLVFYRMPRDLRSRPTLLVTTESRESGRIDVTLGYSTRGLGWGADYIALWSEEANQLELSGRATLSNTSGADFSEAELSLIAGTVNRADAPPIQPVTRMQAGPIMADAKSMPARQQFADVHRYTLRGKISLADQQVKQVALFGPALLAVEREYVSENSIMVAGQTGEPRVSHPQARLRFRNDARDRAGGPMPAGVVRVYKLTDAAGLPWLIGEDRIEHTPEGAAVTLTLGEAFDVTVLRRQTAFTQSGLPQGVSERSWVIDVRNAREQPVTVRLVEVVSGEWTILAESASHEKETADRLVWRVQVPPKGEAQLTYRIRVQL